MVCSHFSAPLSRRWFRFALAAAVLVGGHLIFSRAASCVADEPDEAVRLSPDTLTKYRKVRLRLDDLDDFLQAIAFERPAILELNYFAMSVGGIDALKDLEEGRGVDPETFAALYAGYAVPAVARELNMSPVREGGWKITSPDGRLRYKDTVVRMYSPARLSKLFDRREQFRDENERRRRQMISEYVYARRRESGQLDLNTDGNEVDELLKQITDLQPVLAELESALRSERTVSSILQGESSLHYFGMSVGGIDVIDDLQTRHAVDPETLAAIYAQRISSEHARMIQVNADGLVLYENVPIKLYSIRQLEDCFNTRNLLVLQAGRR